MAPTAARSCVGTIWIAVSGKPAAQAEVQHVLVVGALAIGRATAEGTARGRDIEGVVCLQLYLLPSRPCRQGRLAADLAHVLAVNRETRLAYIQAVYRRAGRERVE